MGYIAGVIVTDKHYTQREVAKHYVLPLEKALNQEDSVGTEVVSYKGKARLPAVVLIAEAERILDKFKAHNIRYLLIADPELFKKVTKVSKTANLQGYCLPVMLDGYTHMFAVLTIKIAALVHNIALKSRISQSINTIADKVNGCYQAVGVGIIHKTTLPEDIASIEAQLDHLLSYPSLRIDIESFGLYFYSCGIASIAFGTSLNEGTGFLCDYVKDDAGDFAERIDNKPVKQALRRFFDNYTGEAYYHGSTFDLKVLIFELYMDRTLGNHKGMMLGIETMFPNSHCTKTIAYLATNNAQENVLGLKHLAQPFAGDYGEDVTDVSLLTATKLLTYNIVDVLSTEYVRSVYWDVLVADDQLKIYNKIFKPTTENILIKEIHGMPISMTRVLEVEVELLTALKPLTEDIRTNPIISDFNENKQQRAFDAAHKAWKVKTAPLSAFAGVVFNHASNPDLQQLLYVDLGLPIEDFTKNGNPATGGKILKKKANIIKSELAAGTCKLSAHEGELTIRLLTQLGAASKIEKILSTFIKVFKLAPKHPDGLHYLHTNFNGTGTKSGRQSSNDPNLNNIPSGSTYGSLIKSCFIAPEGKVRVGADHASLEDRISALQTRDPNKLKVYIDGYDGHSLRALSYYPDELTDITYELSQAKTEPERVVTVNSISTRHKKIRSKGKEPTFLMTYRGTPVGLVNTVGLAVDVAQSVYKAFHELYVESDIWVDKSLYEASLVGYATLAFGLRLRVPAMKLCNFGSGTEPYVAYKEGMTLGNAFGQSYSLLTSHGSVLMNRRIQASKWKYEMFPIGDIYDAIYHVIPASLEAVKWYNDNLIECMRWNELPEIQHDTVKLEANVDIQYPTWAEELTLPNNATELEIARLWRDYRSEEE